MKQTIRLNTFETNSSSTHNCVIGTKEQFDQLRIDELYIYDNEIITKEDLLKICEEEGVSFESFILENNCKWEDYIGRQTDYLEHSCCTKEIGDQIIEVHCFYGRDD